MTKNIATSVTVLAALFATLAGAGCGGAAGPGTEPASEESTGTTSEALVTCVSPQKAISCGGVSYCAYCSDTSVHIACVSGSLTCLLTTNSDFGTLQGRTGTTQQTSFPQDVVATPR